MSLNTFEGKQNLNIDYLSNAEQIYLQIFWRGNIENSLWVWSQVGAGLSNEVDKRGHESSFVSSRTGEMACWFITYMSVNFLGIFFCGVLTVHSVRFVPNWFPGAGFKRKAEAWGKLLYSQALIPLNFVKREIVWAQKRFYPELKHSLLFLGWRKSPAVIFFEISLSRERRRCWCRVGRLGALDCSSVIHWWIWHGADPSLDRKFIYNNSLAVLSYSRLYQSFKHLSL